MANTKGRHARKAKGILRMKILLGRKRKKVRN